MMLLHYPIQNSNSTKKGLSRPFLLPRKIVGLQSKNVIWPPNKNCKLSFGSSVVVIISRVSDANFRKFWALQSARIIRPKTSYVQTITLMRCQLRLIQHRVLRGLSTYPKNIRTLKHDFFGAKPHGEQRLLKVFCPLWENPANIFEKKPFGLVNKVLEGK